MAKKFGKFLLLSAAVTTAAAAAYYFVRKKDADMAMFQDDDDDYDDFSDDLDDDTDTSMRTYVSLNRETTDASEQGVVSEDTSSEDAASDFTPLAEQLAQNSGNAEETIEEFFDEDDAGDEEPPITDN